MARKTVIIIEDSSKVNFGGGQQISLLVGKILNEVSDLIFVDYTSKSNYIKYIQRGFPKTPIVSLKSRLLNSPEIPNFLKRLYELITLKLYFRSNFNRLCELLPFDKQEDLITYVASKKGLTLAYELYKKYKIPYVFHAHLVENPQDIMFEIMLPYLRSAHCIICTSQTVLSSYKNLNNTIMQYNSKPFIEMRKDIRPKKHFTVAFVGSLISIKGVEYFIDAAKLVDSDLAEFRIYGEGPLRYKLEKQAHDNVHFMGFCNDVVNEILQEIDILVLPTIIEEALPTVIIEAKAVGIPVITTNIGGQAEIVKDGQDGILVNIESSNEIAQALNRLIHDTKLYYEMACNSFESSELFSFDQFKRIIIKTLLFR